MHPLAQILLALAAVIFTGQILARVLARFGQPAVIAEVLAGILLGPSLLGPELSARILPASIAPSLSIVAELGVILYMFVVGLEVDLRELRAQGRAIVAISWASIMVPFAVGMALAPRLQQSVGPEGVAPLAFSLFIGVAMSITAFPVLARILHDRGMARTPAGRTALSAAAIDDVTAWCLLAMVVGIARAQMGSAFQVVGLVLLYLAVMLLAVRPLAVRYAERHRSAHVPQSHVGMLFVGLLLSAMATELIGIHAIFGAFVFGALIPSAAPVAHALCTQLKGMVTVLLLPAFFAFTGMRTRIDLLDTRDAWWLCAWIIAVAVAGKFLGALLGARIGRVPWADAKVIAVLMNTRGLMELVVLNIGFELGIISPPLFAMMVIMALVTTMMTGPLLALMRR